MVQWELKTFHFWGPSRRQIYVSLVKFKIMENPLITKIIVSTYFSQTIGTNVKVHSCQSVISKTAKKSTTKIYENNQTIMLLFIFSKKGLSSMQLTILSIKKQQPTSVWHSLLVDWRAFLKKEIRILTLCLLMDENKLTLHKIEPYKHFCFELVRLL